MSERVKLRLRMELLSDAIFGAGFSIPGGEDISVYTDGEGYPYFKAASLKGLLRESLENLLRWTGERAAEADALLGADGWEGADSERRVLLTDLTLTDKPADPEDCFDRRTFTALEDGIVKEGSLRGAVCIRRGLVLEGEAVCLAADAELLEEALELIKWTGASRNRGFGRVHLTAEREDAAAEPASLGAAGCIHYVLRTELPLIITKLSASGGNGYETRSYIPGSSLRGLVIGAVARKDPAWFGAHKEALLSGVRFLNAVPSVAGRPGIPSLMGFYEDKAEKDFESVLRSGDTKPGYKRAKVGAYCAPGEDTLLYRGAETAGYTRIDRRHTDGEDTGMFQTRHIPAGQEFEGYILLDEPALAEQVAAALEPVIWLGADRFEGFGRCRVLTVEAAETPASFDAYGYRLADTPGEELYMTALSPLTMLDALGEPCGLALDKLAEALGVERAEVVFCSTSVSEYGGYNRTWACREPAVRMYDSGSMFKLRLTPAPTAAALRRVQENGLGIRCAEGFGQVLFLRKDLYEGLTKKRAAEEPEETEVQRRTAELRRSRLRWIMDNAPRVYDKNKDKYSLSLSQVGDLQAYLEKDLAAGNLDAKGLKDYLERRIALNAETKRKYSNISELINDVLGAPLSRTLDCTAASDDPKDKLRLLVELFDFSRK